MKFRLAALLVISCQLNHLSEARKSDTLIGKLTQDDIATFARSLAVGFVHGYANRTLENPHAENNIEVHGLTLVGAATFEHAINESPEKLSIYWGHGIGQLISESATLKNHGIQFNIRPNTALILAFFKSISRL